ncbi:MAG: LCP family protein [Candidatus Velamenicoccus archaeovorus]
MSGRHRVRHPVRVAAVWAVVISAVAAIAAFTVSSRSGGEPSPAPGSSSTPRPTLTLLIVRTAPGPLMAVVASGPDVEPAIVVVPPTIALTIPGQGDGRAMDAGELPAIDAATAISNLLGVWIPHVAVTDAEHLAAVIDRAGGVEAFGSVQSGEQVRDAIDHQDPARGLTWRQALRGLFAVAPAWSSEDFLETDDAGAVAVLLEEAKGAVVRLVPTERTAPGYLRTDPEALTRFVAEALGGPSTTPVPVVVLNGSGAPGVGQAVAARLIPAGFRVSISENASSFDHDTTLVVAGTSADQGAAERVQALLGVGTVSVAGVPSGLGDVTIVVGKDYQTE